MDKVHTDIYIHGKIFRVKNIHKDQNVHEGLIFCRGKTADVGWSMDANHGGGYSYRLCKINNGERSELTEECFQRTPLKFANNLSWQQTGYDLSTRRYFIANRTTTGTHPPGSEWTKNPVANCAGLGGGFFDEDPNCPSGFQFPPHLEGLWGQGIWF